MRSANGSTKVRSIRLIGRSKPISHPVPPEVDHDESLVAPLDAFIVKRLEAKHLQLSPPASAADLIRRVYADTIGLPPSPETVDQLTANWSDDGYVRLVDRLLADPAFGDRWARNWLDVVRFAEDQQLRTRWC